MNATAELHLFIIWSNASQQKEDIITDLKKEFEIVKIFKVIWKKKDFINNLRVFYSHSQYHLNESDYKKLLKGKIDHCGKGSFVLIVVKDNEPKYLKRDTSSGLKSVNVNIFDKKTLYRKWTGGGHKIHATDTISETNKDLTLLLGLNISDFKKKYDNGNNYDVIIHKKNCLGLGGFNSIREFFYLLNSSLKYVVLRNFELLPENYFEEMHNDIDMLVEDLNYVVYLTNAIPIFPRQSYRIHYSVKIDKKNIPFDFRFVGDNYYDEAWEKNILDQRIFRKECFFVPDDHNYFYSLLYHACVHKRNISIDYIIKIIKLAQKINLDKSIASFYDEKSIHEILFNYLDEYGFKWLIPKDKSVYFNAVFIDGTFGNHKYNSIANSISYDKLNSKIYKGIITFEYPQKIIKTATNPIANNENRFLTKLKSEKHFPNVVSFKEGEKESIVELEFINGSKLDELGIGYFSSFDISHLIRIINHLLDILIILNDHDIVHRDIRPANIILKHDLPVLIDFGWSKFRNEDAILPSGLGDKYRYRENKFSDAHSMGKIIYFHFSRQSIMLKLLSRKLLSINENDYNSKSRANRKLIGCKIYLDKIMVFASLEYKIWIFVSYMKKRGINIVRKIIDFTRIFLLSNAK